LFLLLILTVIGGVVVWAAILFYAVELSIFGQHEAVRNLLLALGALLGVPFVIWRTLIASQQISINRQSHYTDLYTKAVEQLGSDKVLKRREFVQKYRLDHNDDYLRDAAGNPIPAKRATGEPLGDWNSVEVTEVNVEVRLGAIYALERIARESKKDHWSIMEVLCAYVRENSRSAPVYEKLEIDLLNYGINNKYFYRAKFNSVVDWVSKLEKPRVDIQAAITVIGRRTPIQLEWEEANSQKLDFRFARLAQANFAGGNFSGALFSGCDLNGADFRRSTLHDADFSNAQLNGASFIESKARMVTFSHASCIGGWFLYSQFERGIFFRADMRIANLSTSNFYCANFMEANCEGADLLRSIVIGADFRKVTNADFRRTLAGDGTTKISEEIDWPIHWPNWELSQISTRTLIDAATKESTLINVDYNILKETIKLHEISDNKDEYIKTIDEILIYLETAKMTAT
jgi:uncharacterized protein YjbI with pentapeptide repeats